MKKVGDPLAETPTITSEMFKEVLCPIGDDHEQLFAIPTLADLGFEESTTLSAWTGGEYHALKRLEEKMADEKMDIVLQQKAERMPSKLRKQPEAEYMETTGHRTKQDQGRHRLETVVEVLPDARTQFP